MSNEFFTAPVQYQNDHPYLLLDSGAFSNYASGTEVDIAAYAAYIAVAKGCLLSAVNLDRIPGSLEEWATPEEAEVACIGSFENWKWLQRETGEALVPVFHQNDDERWLWRYVDQGARFIGISPTDSYPRDRRLRWLYDTHWLLDTSGVLNREVYTHGFGVFSPTFQREVSGMMWSADASTMMRYSGLRRLILPLDVDGEISPYGELHSWHPVYVGQQATSAAHDEDVLWKDVGDYLDVIRLGGSYDYMNGRILMENIHAVSAANIHAVRLLMQASRVRCFIAGSDERVSEQIVVEERFPYILRSYAAISEKTGATFRRLYERKRQI